MFRIPHCIVLIATIVGCSAARAPNVHAGPAPGDVPPGFDRVTGVPCPESVCASSGHGGIRNIDVLRYNGSVPVRLYRVFATQGHLLGAWWSFTPPQGTAEAFRERFEICPEFNDFAHVMVCPLVQGAQIMVGTGQSMTCQNNVTYPTSDALQVFIASPAAAIDEHGCEPVTWEH